MLKFIAALMLAVLCGAAEAKCTARDKWHGPDKVMHAQAGAVLGYLGTSYEGNIWHGVGLAAAAGAAKELLDSDGSGQCSVQDFAVTVAGGLLGATIARGVYVYLDPRGKSAGIAWSVTLP